MPVRRVSTTRGGKKAAGYKYGASGKVYTYTPGNASSRRAAKAKAEKQGKAVRTRRGS